MAYIGNSRAPTQSGIIEKLQSAPVAPVEQPKAPEPSMSKDASGAAAIPGATQSMEQGKNTSK